MKTTPTILGALALCATLSGQASAQPAVTSSEPPPAGGDGKDVSQINGHPVKVGEHNEYYYRFRRTNISANPIGWLAGFWGLSASYGATSHVAIRADVNYYSNIMDSGTNGYEVGLSLPIYFRRTYQGIFLEPGLIVRQMVSNDYYDGTSYEDRPVFGPQVLVGWQWMWDSGLNVAFAAGLGRNLDVTHDNDPYSGEETLFGNGYVRFGYAF